MSKLFYVYHLIDPISNTTFYIGKGQCGRMFRHENNVKNNIIPNNNKHLFHKIKEIHAKNLSVVYKKVIETPNESLSFMVESLEIKKIGRSDLGLGPLCNLTDGGEGGSGKRLSCTGPKNHMFGKKHKEESKRIMSEKRRNRNLVFKHTESHKQNLKINNAGGKATSKPVFQLDGYVVVKRWSSLSEAARVIGANKANICTSIKTGWRCKGYNWRYDTDFNKR